MKRALFLAALFCTVAFVPARAGDIAVFKDHRSLNIDGYTVHGKWMVLKLNGGKMAVPLKRIKVVRDDSGRQLYPAAKSGSSHRSKPPEKAAGNSGKEGHGKSKGERGGANKSG